MVKFNKIVDYVLKNYSNVCFEYRVENGEVLKLEASIVAPDIKGYVFTIISVYDDGEVEFELVYDEINKCFEVYNIINDFNYNSGFIKAYIMENKNGNFLKLFYKSTIIPNEKNIFETIDKMLYELSSDNTLKLLEDLDSYMIYEEEWLWIIKKCYKD